jgi:hypothetical protein
MKKSLFIGVIIVTLLAAVLLSGCTRVPIGESNGSATTKYYNFTDFRSIEIGYAFKLEVTRADTYSVEINAAESTFEHIKVTQTGGKLEIGMDRLFFNFKRSPRVKITMPELRGLYMSGASEGSVMGFRSSQDFDLTLSGASDLDIMDMETGDFSCEVSGASKVVGSLKAKSCDIELSGASEMKLGGLGGNIRLDASGASRAQLMDFSVNDADISLSGASDASLDVNGMMDLNLSGASTLEYTGNPTLGEFSLTGGSELERK